MGDGYEVFCHWPAWGQYAWTVASVVVVGALGFIIGWFAKAKELRRG